MVIGIQLSRLMVFLLSRLRRTITNVFNFEELSHGTHTLSLQAKSVLSTGTIIYSNTLEYLMIVAEPDNVVPIIASKFSQDSAPEGTVVLVDYIAYQLGLELVNVEFFVDDVSVGTSQVDRSRNTWRIAGLALGSTHIEDGMWRNRKDIRHRNY